MLACICIEPYNLWYLQSSSTVPIICLVMLKFPHVIIPSVSPRFDKSGFESSWNTFWNSVWNFSGGWRGLKFLQACPLFIVELQIIYPHYWGLCIIKIKIAKVCRVLSVATGWIYFEIAIITGCDLFFPLTYSMSFKTRNLFLKVLIKSVTAMY